MQDKNIFNWMFNIGYLSALCFAVQDYSISFTKTNLG